MNVVEKLCRNFLRSRGYVVSKFAPESGDFALRGYENAGGDFDYDRYVAVQTEGNHAKIDNVWADEETIGVICDYLRSTGAPLRRGLCHGSRNAAEVRWFRERLGIEITGTDISDTAEEFGLVQWDYHKPREDWVGRFDFIYTNAHDHAYDPRLAFSTWIDQLTDTGVLVIEHTMAHSPSGVSELDPFGVDPRVLPYVLLNFSEGRYAVTRIINPPHWKRGSPIWIFVIRPQNRLSR